AVATRTTPVAAVAAALFASGFGVGLFQVPNMSTVMGAFPAGQQGAAGGLAFMARTLGIVTRVGPPSQSFSPLRNSGFEVAFTTAFVVAGAAVLAATAAACIPLARTLPPRASDGRRPT